jgi:DNA-binding transcriptional LysR family regulator
MKQMNVLEAEVGVQLLVRTNHGIRPTDAGASFYQDAKFLTQYAEKTIIRTRQAAHSDTDSIRVGNSMLNPCQPLLDLWNPVSPGYPQFKMKIVPLGDSAVWPTIYQTIGKDFDVVVGAYERASEQSAFQALRLGEYRFCVAVSRAHPLASKERLAVSDLYGERFAAPKPGISPSVDAIRGYLAAEHPEIQVKGVFDHYFVDVFNRCEEHNAIVLTLDAWKDVHPSLVTIPVDWHFTIPYGLVYPLRTSSNVQHFVNALQEALVASPL